MLTSSENKIPTKRVSIRTAEIQAKEDINNCCVDVTVTVEVISYRCRGIILYKALSGPFEIPNSVTEIDNGFLKYCHQLKKPPIIPDSVTLIGDEFLYECYDLREAPRIPNSVVSIGHCFLADCYDLREPPIIPNSVTKIYSHFLSECHDLTEPPIIPSSVTRIGACFLFGCNQISQTFNKWNITIGDNVNKSHEYWKRKEVIKRYIILLILDLPYHIDL